MFKLENNLILLEQKYEYQIINDAIGIKEYKSPKGIINRLWDLYK